MLPAVPPTIPSTAIGWRTEEHDAVLLWVHTGVAHVDAAGTRHPLVAGQALWVPPGVEHRTRTEAGTVIFPLFLRHAESTGALSAVRTIRIPPGWTDWLVHLWDDNTDAEAALLGEDALVQLLRGSAGGGGRPGDALPSPNSAAARAVARAVLGRPAAAHTLGAHAAAQRVSQKTLHRQFTAEAGMSFSAWRTAVRITLAARSIAEGESIDRARRSVGFTTAAGFTKAFRRLSGITPSEHLARSRDPAPAPMPAPPYAMPLPPRVPARRLWEKVNDQHELLWMHRGTAELRIGARPLALMQGQAVWIPAGLAHTIDLGEGALLMTIGRAHGRIRIPAQELRPVQFPADWEPFLLHTMIGEYTLFRPASGHGAITRALFHEQFIAQRRPRPDLLGTPGEIAFALHHDPADRRSLSDWAARFRTTPAALGAVFRAETGLAYPRWRSQVRMNIAREMLVLGATPGQVATHLGYAHVAAFSRAFRHTYRMTPRQYQHREASTITPTTPAPAPRLPSEPGQ